MTPQGLDRRNGATADELCNGVREPEEIIILGNKICLAINLYHRGPIACDMQGNDALGSDPCCGLAGLAAEFYAQNLFGFSQITIGLG